MPEPDARVIDIGANIGSYTVLASGVAGARRWAVEPDPSTVERLARNLEMNDIDDKVVVYLFALGDRESLCPNAELELRRGEYRSNSARRTGSQLAATARIVGRCL